jgi:SnoaL-like domain
MDLVMLAPASDPRLPGPVQLFQRAFRELRPETPFPYEQLYAPDVIFEDPLHRADGLAALRRHFERLNANLRVCHFEYGPAFVEADEAVLSWTMKLELRRGPRQPVVVSGMTHVRFGDRVSYQRDHFDAGALVYEHVPLLGWLIRLLKRRL